MTRSQKLVQLLDILGDILYMVFLRGMHLMHTVLSHLIDKTVIVYSDDIVMYSKNPAHHKKYLHEC